MTWPSKLIELIGTLNSGSATAVQFYATFYDDKIGNTDGITVHLSQEIDEDGTTYPWDDLTSYMDDDSRELVHSELAPCTAAAFLTRYVELDPSFLGRMV